MEAPLREIIVARSHQHDKKEDGAAPLPRSLEGSTKPIDDPISEVTGKTIPA